MPETETYTPEVLPRRGEINAWILTVLVAGVLAYLQARGSAPTWIWLFVGFLLFSAGSISLGNWVDRHTRLEINTDGITFENGLRRVKLTWAEIVEVRTSPARWGQHIQVLGQSTHFAFNTLGEMTFRGQVSVRTGFAKGKELLDKIIRSANLVTMKQENAQTIYSR